MMMFCKLQLQFILTNLTIITVLFLALTLGVYILLEVKMKSHQRFLPKTSPPGLGTTFTIQLPVANEAQGNYGAVIGGFF
jgi:hypothetical protein